MSLYGLFQPSRIHAFASKAAKLSLVQTLATLLCAGCVDVTPPWDQVAPQTGGTTETATTDGVLPALRTGGMLGGGGVSGTGGMANTSPLASEDAAVAGAMPADAAVANTGGAAGGGGATVADAPLGTGGGEVAGGKLDGAPSPGTVGSVDGGAMTDVPRGTGGAPSDGVRDAGGDLGVGSATGGTTTRTGGTTARTGGTVGTGGAMGTGGRLGTGGSGTGGTLGTGGTTSITRLPYNCASAIAPTDGIVTSFTDWNETDRTWGTTSGLYGSIFSYADTNASFGAAKVEGSPKALHLKGSVSGGFGGGGLSFWVCTTVADFTAVQFDIYGSGSGCAVQMQIQLFDQRPDDQNPPGSCLAASSTGCFHSPALNDIVDLSSAIPATSPKHVTKTFASFTDNTSWSASSAVQVVGLQWQFAGSSCAADVYITNVKFTKP